MSKSHRDPKDPFFHGGIQIFIEATKTFNMQGIKFSYPVLCDIFSEVCDHVSHLHGHFPDFWHKIDPDEIDLSNYHTSFYDLVLGQLGVSHENISWETFERREKLWLVKINWEVTLAMNHFFRYLLKQLQANPKLVVG